MKLRKQVNSTKHDFHSSNLSVVSDRRHSYALDIPNYSMTSSPPPPTEADSGREMNPISAPATSTELQPTLVLGRRFQDRSESSEDAPGGMRIVLPSTMQQLPDSLADSGSQMGSPTMLLSSAGGGKDPTTPSTPWTPANGTGASPGRAEFTSNATYYTPLTPTHESRAAENATMAPPTPLTTPSSTGSSATERNHPPAVSSIEDTQTWVKRCCLELLEIGVPSCFSVTVSNAAFLYTMGFAAHHLPLVEFAGLAMGLTFSNITANALGVGLSCALDTLCSQEYGRNPDSKKVGLYFQRSIVGTILVFLPLSGLYLFSEPLLSAIMNQEVASYAALWLKMSFMVSIPTVWTSCLQKYVQCHGVAGIVLYSSVLGTGTVPILLSWFGPQGIIGLMIALALNRLVVLVALGFFVQKHKACRRTWGGWSKECLQWGPLVEYFEVGTPNMVAFCADLWGFEAMAVMAAHIGTVEVAVWTVVVNIFTIFWGPCVGVCSAAAVKVGNALGAGLAREALRMMRCALGLSVVVGIGCGVLTILFGHDIVTLLQNDATVIQDAIDVRVSVALALALDVVFYVLQGLYRGCGKQNLGAMLVAVGHWCVGIPLSWYLSVVRGYGITGILIGFVAGMLVICPIFLFYLLRRFNWHEMANVIGSKKNDDAPPVGSNIHTAGSAHDVVAPADPQSQSAVSVQPSSRLQSTTLVERHISPQPPTASSSASAVTSPTVFGVPSSLQGSNAAPPQAAQANLVYSTAPGASGGFV
jgi:MATE family multidrug resistance protein